MNPLIIIYAGINLLVWILYGIDKYKAIKKYYRISEKRLIIMSALGPIGGLIGMFLFRHKTRKPLFRILVPLFLLIHIAILILSLV